MSSSFSNTNTLGMKSTKTVSGGAGDVTWQGAATSWQGGAVTW